MNILKKIFTLIFLSNKTLKRPKSKDILIINKDFSHLLSFYYKNISESLDTRFHILPNRKLNLYILFKCIIKFELSFFSYVCEYIRCVNPKLIITFIDNDILFYRLKKFFPTAKTIMIQNANRTLQEDDILFNFKKLKKLSLKVDYYFCFNKEIGSKFSSFLNCQIIPIGSFRSNFNKKKKVKKKYDYLYISVFRHHEKIRKEDLIFFKNLERYLTNQKKQLHILGSTSRIQAENKYYKKMFQKLKFNLIQRDSKRNAYKILDRSKIIINVDSTAGYEALSRSNKVGFFCIRGDKFPLNSLRFGWPNSFKKRGPFWTNKNDYEELKRVMDYLKQINYQKFISSSRQISKTIMRYDPGNKIFRDYLPGLIN